MTNKRVLKIDFGAKRNHIYDAPTKVSQLENDAGYQTESEVRAVVDEEVSEKDLVNRNEAEQISENKVNEMVDEITDEWIDENLK